VAWLYPQALGSLFVASYDSHGYGGGIRPLLHMGLYEHIPVFRLKIKYVSVAWNNLTVTHANKLENTQKKFNFSYTLSYQSDTSHNYDMIL
jgi:hypothetical protein